MAIDTLGNLYACYTQVNTDANVVAMYLRILCSLLDEDRPGWRRNTVLLLDNARGHTGERAVAAIRQLEIPVMFLPPYAYSVAPIEKLFARLKATNLNPEGKPTGKK